MKKTFTLGILIALFAYFGINPIFAYTSEESKEIINNAIQKYKDKNYIGCISDLKIYNQENEKNAVSWYYLGNAYMNIAMKNDAKDAFNKVIELNTVPILTSYSVQAKLCMDDPTKCKYQDYNYDEIQKLRADPLNFLEQLINAANVPEEVKDENVVEIEKLIDHSYPGQIHPEAQAFIEQENVRIQQSKMNAARTKATKDTNKSTTANEPLKRR